jgi:hypothetical protein
MKNLNTQLILLITALSFTGIGCSKSGGGGFDAGTPVTVDTTAVAPLVPPAITHITTSTTPTITFTPVSTAEMNAYVGSTPLNNPTNYSVQISLAQLGTTGRYSGSVQLSYDDNGYHHNGTFTADTGYNSSYDSYGTARDVGLAHANYNYWFNLGGKTVFSGFFQDNYGGIVLVIDNAANVNQGDGQGGGTISGQIWYRNFATSYAPQSTERNCWFIYGGPYDCRSNIVSSKSALYPTDSYRKLGDFSGVLASSVSQ